MSPTKSVVPVGILDLFREPCHHKVKDGFPCAEVDCARGSERREIVIGGKIYRRSKIDRKWTWATIE